jgi:hypothetical protein
MYQDFEIPRVKAAFAAFEKAFEDGYVEGLKLLAEGAERMADVPQSFPIDVSRDNIVDGNWSQHLIRFDEAGHTAALAARRKDTSKAKLDATEASEDSHPCFDLNVYRWHVVVNPTT